MRKLILIPAAVLALVLTGCVKDPQEACTDHGGLKSVVANGQIMKASEYADAPEGAEAVCNDNTEFEFDGTYWTED